MLVCFFVVIKNFRLNLANLILDIHNRKCYEFNEEQSELIMKAYESIDIVRQLELLNEKDVKKEMRISL